jgi:hypothetical protein
MPTDFDSDAMLSFLSELTKKFADLKKEMVSVGDQSGTGLHKASDETDRFGKTVELHTKKIAGMKDETAGLVGLLRGPVGLAGLLAGAGQVMANFTRGELQLRNFATDVGISASAIQRMRVQLSAAGIDAKTADQQISALTSKLDSIKTLTTASPVYKDIAANDPILAKQLLDAERVGNRLKSIQLIQEKLNEPGAPRSKLYLQDKLGINASTAQALGKDTKGLVMPWVYDEKVLEKANKDWTNLTTTMSNVWGYTLMGMVGQTNEFVENTKREIRALREFFKQDITGPKGILPSTEEIKNLFSRGDTFKDRFGEWGDQDEGALPKNARPRSFSPEGIEKDELELQKDSNKTLQDIRDLLSGDKEGIWGGGGSRGGGGYPGSSGAGTPGTPRRGGTGADGRVPETSDDPAYGGAAGLNRDAFRKELEAKPWLKEKILGIASGENKDPTANLAVIESMMNRAAARGTSLEQAAKVITEGSGGYYAGFDPAALRRPEIRKMIERNLEKALAGSNVSDYATDNASGPLAAREAASGSFTFKKKYAGESFFSPGTSGGGAASRQRYEAWRERVEKEKRDAAAAPGSFEADNEARARMRDEAIRKRQEQFGNDAARTSLEKSLVASRDLGGAKIKVDFSGTSQGSTADAKVLDEGPFKKLKIARSPQAPMAGGGVTDFNRFSFE